MARWAFSVAAATSLPEGGVTGAAGSGGSPTNVFCRPRRSAARSRPVRQRRRGGEHLVERPHDRGGLDLGGHRGERPVQEVQGEEPRRAAAPRRTAPPRRPRRRAPARGPGRACARERRSASRRRCRWPSPPAGWPGRSPTGDGIRGEPRGVPGREGPDRDADEQPHRARRPGARRRAGSRRSPTGRGGRAGQVEEDTRPWCHGPAASRTARYTRRVVTIAHISDPHVGSPYFVPNLMNRVIAELNELATRRGRGLQRRPDERGVPAGVQDWLAYAERIEAPLLTVPGNHDARNVGYLHFEELIGPRMWSHDVGDVRIVGRRLQRARPERRPGRVASTTTGSRERFAGPAALKVFVLHHHLLPIPGTGRERSTVMDAGDLLEVLIHAGVNVVLSGHKHVPYVWRLEDLYIANAGTVSSLRVRGLHEAVLQRAGVRRRRGEDPPRLPVRGRAPPDGALRPLRVGAVATVNRPCSRRRAWARPGSPPVRPSREGHRHHPMSALVLVDGEHYPPVTRWAIEVARQRGVDVVAAVLVGGAEKLGAGERPTSASRSGGGADRAEARGLGDRRAASRARARSVRRARPRLPRADGDRRRDPRQGASPTPGADFRFDPPTGRVRRPWGFPRSPSSAPASAPARRRSRASSRGVPPQLGLAPIVVAMGRGGPAGAAGRRGGHGDARDAPGARPSGRARRVGLPGGRPDHRGHDGRRPPRRRRARRRSVRRATSREAVALAVGASPGLLILEGSGASIPPVAWDAGVLVVPADCPPEYLTGYLGPYRLLRADLGVVTMVGSPVLGPEALSQLIRTPPPSTRRCASRASPTSARSAGRCARTGRVLRHHRTADRCRRPGPAPRSHVGCRVVGWSARLADRAGLAEDLDARRGLRGAPHGAEGRRRRRGVRARGGSGRRGRVRGQPAGGCGGDAGTSRPRSRR